MKKVIGLSHSGWRGTVGKIGKVTVEKMQKEFGCDPKHILGAVGPSICQDCYEVSEDVIDRFRENFKESLWPELFYKKDNGKYQLNLWKANESIFLESGLLPEHIAVTNVCTHCNPDILFSHRTTGNVGHKTLDSFPGGRPLPKRRNIVITRSPDFHREGCETVSTPEDALALAGDEENVWLIGGGSIYAALLGRCRRASVTRVWWAIGFV